MRLSHVVGASPGRSPRRSLAPRSTSEPSNKRASPWKPWRSTSELPLTRADLHEELQAFALEVVSSTVAKQIDRLRDELQQILLDGSAGTQPTFEVPRASYAGEDAAHAWVTRAPMARRAYEEDDIEVSKPMSRMSSASAGRPRSPVPSTNRASGMYALLGMQGDAEEEQSGDEQETPTAQVPRPSSYVALPPLAGDHVVGEADGGADGEADGKAENPKASPMASEGCLLRESSRELAVSGAAVRPSSSCRQWTKPRQLLRTISRHPAYEYTIGLLVLINAAMLGIETNFRALNPGESTPRIMSVIELVFCGIFTVEIALRLYLYGSTFFTVNGWAWNAFDFGVVSLQLLEQLSDLLVKEHRYNLSFVRLVRILRLIRVTRVLRVLRMVEELRTIISSIAGSLKSLFWSLVLLLMTLYTFSVLLTQLVTDARAEAGAIEVVRDLAGPQEEQLDFWFGSICRTLLTIFESILGGATWDPLVRMLAEEVSPGTGSLFCFYIAFCVFALMNVVTGFCVEKATRTVQEDNTMYLANHISDLFFGEHKDADGDRLEVITWELFRSKLDSPDMRDYFKAINVDPSEARGLFDLLDVERAGCLDSGQVVNGLLRLRGNARALELSLLMHETTRMHQREEVFQALVERRLLRIIQVLHPVLKYVKAQGAPEGISTSPETLFEEPTPPNTPAYEQPPAAEGRALRDYGRGPSMSLHKSFSRMCSENTYLSQRSRAAMEA